MNRELLEKPFEKEQIKQRKGNFGDTIDYVETHAVIQHLNDAFDGQWSFEILSQESTAGEVIVLGKLTADGVSETQFGC
jgi:recombination DNA repair RAD52 pathway protein